jgi:putative restriction endonuclease
MAAGRLEACGLWYDGRGVDGFIAVTDPGWHEYLSRVPGPKDASFWRPSVRAFRLEVGTPFLFKLKAPHHAIAGFGYFVGFAVLPDWLAWETFGEANGVEGLGELRGRLARIQKGARIEADPMGRIGCCLIAEAVFFEPYAWVAAPRGWKPRTVTGARYDLAVGEGCRVWKECLERTGAAMEALADGEPSARYGTPALHVPRLGQGIFRVKVLDAYGRACAVTQEHSLPVLEAAHIKPYALGGEHRVANGLSLRSDLHRLFDRGYVTVDERHRFVVGDRLKRDFHNGRSCRALHGQPLALPDAPALRPDPAALEWHRSQAFLG